MGSELVPCIAWEKGCDQGLDWRSGLGGLPTSLVVVCASCMCSTLLLLLALQKWLLGLGSFCIFLYIICSNCACMQLFVVLYNFFVFITWDFCLGASTAAKGPRFQPVSKSYDVWGLLLIISTCANKIGTRVGEMKWEYCTILKVCRSLLYFSVPLLHIWKFWY